MGWRTSFTHSFRKESRRPSYRPTLETLESRLAPANFPPGFAETLITGSLVAPTAMDFAPDGRLFVTEQGGTLRIIENGALLPTPFVSLNVDSTGERGLLGVTFDPNFASDHFVYVYYTATTPTIHNRVSRFTANGDAAVPGSEVDLLDLNDLGPTNHNGGAIHFGPDGKLYIAVGENGTPSNSQTLTNLLGKMLRINADGSIPTDNPFYNSATGVNRAIWALGLRNPFTFSFQPGTGRMFINDVGQSTWEEIDDGIAGSNYGWPITEGPTTDPRFRGPIFYYGHGAGDTLGIAITGGTFYNPAVNQFPSDYTGTYLFADFGNGWIRRLGATVTLFADGLNSPVDLKVGPDGSLFYLSHGGGGLTGAVFEVQYTPNVVTNVQLTSANYSVDESGGVATITVIRTGTNAGTASVDYATSNGTATAGTNYQAVSGTLTFAPGETSKTFTILILDDGTANGNLTVNVALSNATGGLTLSTPASATLTIFDSDQFTSRNQRFVAQVYLDLLGRPVDSSALTFWSGQLDNGLPRSQVVLILEGTVEFRMAQVNNLYRTLLDRDADAAGLNYFVQLLQQGGTLEQVQAVLLGSPEYFQKHGGTNDRFVQGLYYDVFGHAVDTMAQSNLDQFLAAGGSRTLLAAILLYTPEAKQRLVQMTYRQLLRRDADSFSLSVLVNALRQGLRDEILMAVLAGSDEYSGRL